MPRVLVQLGQVIWIVNLTNKIDFQEPATETMEGSMGETKITTSVDPIQNMFLLLLILNLGTQLHQTTALFTVTVPKDLYIVEHGSNVTLECDFYSGNYLEVEHVTATLQKVGNNTSSHSTTLLKEELKGKALFHFSQVQVSDAGKYHCVIGFGTTWDYKYLTLKVKASYKKINTHVVQVPRTDEVELTCQAKGYPLAEVSWPNINVSANTSHVETSDGLYQVTSVLRLKPLPGRNFSCEFWNANVKELTSAIIVSPGKMDPSVPPPLLLHIFIPSFIIVLMAIATMIILRKQLCRKLYSRKGDTRIPVWKRSGHVHELTGDGKSLRTAGTVDRALTQAQKI